MGGHGADGVDWDRMYRRQVERAGEAAAWFDDLELQAGDDVVEIGCGPGHISLLTAERVAPGTVYALDRSAGALGYLASRAVERGADGVVPIRTDATALGICFDHPLAALVTYVLHHADAPARVIHEVAAALAPGSRALVCEYHPDAVGAVGPSLDRRLDPAAVERWVTTAGLSVDRRVEYPNESYGFVVRR